MDATGLSKSRFSSWGVARRPGRCRHTAPLRSPAANVPFASVKARQVGWYGLPGAYPVATGSGSAPRRHWTYPPISLAIAAQPAAPSAQALTGTGGRGGSRAGAFQEAMRTIRCVVATYRSVLGT